MVMSFVFAPCRTVAATPKIATVFFRKPLAAASGRRGDLLKEALQNVEAIRREKSLAADLQDFRHRVEGAALHFFFLQNDITVVNAGEDPSPYPVAGVFVKKVEMAP